MINKSEYKGLLLIAILSPLAALIISTKKINLPFLRLIIPIFYSFVGFTFQVRGGSDATRAVELFEEARQLNMSQFLDHLSFKLDNYLSEGLEIFQFFFSFLISRLTSDYGFILMFYGLFAGLFVSKIIEEILKINKGKGNYKIIFFLLISVMPVAVINGRFWLATTVLIYFLLKYINNNFNIKFLFFCSLVIFVHQGYFFGILFLFLYHLISKTKIKGFIFYTVFGISLFFSTGFAVDYAKNAASNFGGNMERQISGYVNDDYLEEASSLGEGNSRSFIWKVYNFKNDFFYYSILFFSVIITCFNKNINSNYKLIFFAFLMIASLSNFTIGIPNFGSRYRTVATIIGLIYIYTLSDGLSLLKYGYLSKIITPILYLVFLINLRYEFEQMNFFVIFSNIPLLLYDVPEVTVMEFIK